MKKVSLGIICTVFMVSLAARAALAPVDLRCDYAVNPLGVDSPQPAAVLETGRRRARPAADGL